MKIKLKANMAITVNGNRYVSKNGEIDVEEKDIKAAKTFLGIKEKKEGKDGKVSAKVSAE